MANKMTKRDYFNTLLTFEEVKANADMTKFIQHELELLAKKNSSDKKPTKQQEANALIETAILSGLNPDEKYTVTDIIKTLPECADLTNQRVSAILRNMVKSGDMVREEIKRKAYFSIAPVGESNE